MSVGTAAARNVAVVIGLLWIAPNVSHGDRPSVYYDHAQVLKVTPVTSTIRSPVSHVECVSDPDADDDALSPGDIRAADQDVSIGEAIRADTIGNGEHEANNRCRSISTHETEERVIAYEVSYRYGDETFVRRMQRDPGEFVRVRVEIDTSSRPWVSWEH